MKRGTLLSKITWYHCFLPSNPGSTLVTLTYLHWTDMYAIYQYGLCLISTFIVVLLWVGYTEGNLVLVQPDYRMNGCKDKRWETPSTLFSFLPYWVFPRSETKTAESVKISFRYFILLYCESIKKRPLQKSTMIKIKFWTGTITGTLLDCSLYI